MSMEPHIADAETGFMVISVTPDFCRVGEKIVPFDIIALLPPEKANYAATVSAHSEKILMIDSIVAGVIGNAGNGLQSQVSLAEGHVKIISGSDTVFVEGRKTARHGDICEMNGAA